MSKRIQVSMVLCLLTILLIDISMLVKGFLGFCLCIIFIVWIAKYIDEKNFYKKVIGIDIPKAASIIIEKDTHGGFLGDGEYFSIIKISDSDKEEFINNIKQISRWKSLPISDEVKGKIYWRSEGQTYGEYLGRIPRDVKNGAYYFRDRYSEDSPGDSGIGPAYNFDFDIMDYDKKTLYIYVLDT